MKTQSNYFSVNIIKFYLYKICWAFWLVAAIDIVFFRQNNISITQIATLNVIWAVTSFALEVPTGILADRWSRKYMLVLSPLFAAAGFFLFAINYYFLPFAIATIFMAARFSFASGTSNALIYDSLKTIGKESEFEKILGRSKFYAILATSIATILGSFIAAYDIRLVYTLSGVFSLITALVALTFTEPQLHISTGEIKLFDHIKQSFSYTLNHKVVRFLLLYLVFMDVGIFLLDEYDQLYLISISFPLAFFGIWIALRRGLGGLTGFFADKLKNRVDNLIESSSLLVLLFGTLLISIANKYIGLATFLLVFILWGVAEVLAWGKLHNSVESNKRATVESLVVFMTSLLQIPILLSFGYISDRYGIRGGYIFSFVILFAYTIYYFSYRCKSTPQR